MYLDPYDRDYSQKPAKASQNIREKKTVQTSNGPHLGIGKKCFITMVFWKGLLFKMFCESSRKWISDNVRRERKTLHHESVFNFSHHVLDCHKPLDFIPKTLYADNFHTGAMCSTMGSVLFLFRAFWLDYIPKSSLNPWSHAKLHKQWGLTTGCRERGGVLNLVNFCWFWSWISGKPSFTWVAMVLTYVALEELVLHMSSHLIASKI